MHQEILKMKALIAILLFVSFENARDCGGNNAAIRIRGVGKKWKRLFLNKRRKSDHWKKRTGSYRRKSFIWNKTRKLLKKRWTWSRQKFRLYKECNVYLFVCWLVVLFDIFLPSREYFNHLETRFLTGEGLHWPLLGTCDHNEQWVFFSVLHHTYSDTEHPF